MIVCSRFVFLHLHKSGGTFINRMIEACIPYSRRLGYHLPYAMLPENYRRLPILGSVRNPWSYYVSWFQFQSQIRNPNAFFLVCSQNGSLGFEKTIRNLLAVSVDCDMQENIRSELPEAFQNFGINLTRSCLDSWRGDNCGFYTFLYRRLYAGSASPTIVKIENLRQETAEFIRSLDMDRGEAIELYLNKAPNVNESRHGCYRDYYTEGLRKLVAQSDELVIDEYSYVF